LTTVAASFRTSPVCAQARRDGDTADDQFVNGNDQHEMPTRAKNRVRDWLALL